ncbi:MAG: DUF4279 domain-containing protein [Neisseriaceae bacterium]|nr:DUF4279 domain-containing protein [Neisseriaceae bacterium]
MSNAFVNGIPLEQSYEENSPTIKVEFIISGDLINVDIIDKLLQIKNANILKKDELISGKIRPNITNSWTVCTEYTKTYEVEEELLKIITQLKNKIPVLNKIYNMFDDIVIKFCIVISMKNGYTPILYFNNNVLKFISDIHASMDFDLYV